MPIIIPAFSTSRTESTQSTHCTQKLYLSQMKRSATADGRRKPPAGGRIDGSEGRPDQAAAEGDSQCSGRTLATATASIGPEQLRQTQGQRQDQGPRKPVGVHRRVVLLPPAATAETDLPIVHRCSLSHWRFPTWRGSCRAKDAATPVRDPTLRTGAERVLPRVSSGAGTTQQSLAEESTPGQGCAGKRISRIGRRNWGAGT